MTKPQTNQCFRNMLNMQFVRIKDFKIRRTFDKFDFSSEKINTIHVELCGFDAKPSICIPCYIIMKYDIIFTYNNYFLCR